MTVGLLAEKGREAELAAAIAETMQSVSLEPLGIRALRPKRAATGTLILAIPGQGSQEKADALAKAFVAATEGKGVRVTPPPGDGAKRG